MGSGGPAVRFWPGLLLAALLLPGLGAQELSLGVGRGKTLEEQAISIPWQVDFRLNLGSRFALSETYINEGHLPGHKRDGLATEAWYGLPMFRRQLSLGFGVGLYGFADTVTRQDGTFSNVQGVGRIYSVSATYFASTSPAFARLSVNYLQTRESPDTVLTLLGGGYRFGSPPRDAAEDKVPSTLLSLVTPDEITVFLGQTVLNSIQDQKGIAFGAEIRQGLFEHCDWTLTWLHEGDPEVIRRNGLGSQVWLVDTFLPGRFSLGLGAGVYVFLDKKALPDGMQEPERTVAGLASLTLGYRLQGPWTLRCTWNRVFTQNNRDTDDFVVGCGYRM